MCTLRFNDIYWLDQESNTKHTRITLPHCWSSKVRWKFEIYHFYEFLVLAQCVDVWMICRCIHFTRIAPSNGLIEIIILRQTKTNFYFTYNVEIPKDISDVRESCCV